MHLIALGMGIGLLTLLPPGPVNLTLVQVGARLGKHPARRGALGIASGDLLLGWVAVMIVGAGATLPTGAFKVSQAVAAGFLILVGAALLAKPAVAAASVGRLEHPGRALFLLTSLTPSALGAWIALLAAMPFADDRHKLSLFAVGVVIASFLWHPMLGAAASRLGSRLSDTGQLRLSRVGGLLMALLGIALVAPRLL